VVTAPQRRRVVTYLRERRQVGVTRACRLAAAAARGLPACLVCDHGAEFSSRAFLSWARARGIALDFIRPGKPVDNAYVESLNGKLPDECLNEQFFLDLADARGRSSAGAGTKTACGPTAVSANCPRPTTPRASPQARNYA
jgi:transposase InsO family protein